MAYPYYPATYTPVYQQPTPAPQTQAQSNGLTWVQGEAGAKSYLVAPNTPVVLFDSESDRFFIKTADGSGMPQPLRVFEYREVTPRADGATNAVLAREEPSFVTKDEFEALKRLVDDIAKTGKKGDKE